LEHYQVSGLFGSKKSASQGTKAVSALQVQTSTSGQVLPILYGKNLLAGNLAWYGNFVSTPHTTPAASGGKGGGGGGGQGTTTYTYTTGVIISLCEGPIRGTGIIWTEQAQNTAASLGMTIFNGNTPQATWSWITGYAPTQALPYNGTAYAAASALNLGSDTSLPNYNFEVLGPLAYNAGTIDDALPSDIVTDYLTNANHGAGFGTYLGSTASLRAYALARGLFLSPIEDQQRTASSFLDDMATWCNFACVWSYKSLQLIPYGDTPITGAYGTYTPNVTPIYALGADDFLYTGNGTNGVELDWKDAEDCFNSVAIEYNDRTQGYNTSVQNATDQADIDARGPYPMSDVQVNGITTAAVARDVAQLMLQRSLYIRKTYSFSTSMKYMLLEPMDVVTLTDANAGLLNELVRITKVSEQDDQIDFEAEELPIGVAHAPIYSNQSPFGYNQDYNVSAGDVSPPVIFNAPGMLTKTGYETWIAVAGIGAFWGGCQVYFSADNLTYKNIGTISAPARYGALTAALPAGGDPDNTNTLNVAMLTGQLTSGSKADADNWRQFAFIGSTANGGEFVAFQTATLTGTEAYSLSYLRRGGYGSSSQAHVVGDVFARIDDGIFRVPYDRGMVGQTVYFKFASFNEFGGGQESVASAVAYSHVLGASDVLAPPTLFDQLAGQFATPSSGSNFIPNPSFELNNIGAAGAATAIGQPVCDSWYLLNSNTGFSVSRSNITPDVGSNNLLIQIAAGTSIPANTTYTATATSAPIYVQSGQLLSFSGDILTFTTGGNGAGILFSSLVGLQFYNSSGVLISNTFTGVLNVTTGTSSYSNYANNQFTVPAGASYAQAFVDLQANNTSASPQTVASYVARFDNLFGQFVTAANQVNYTTGQSVDSLKPLAANADNTANAATPPVINGGFDSSPTGYGWAADSGTGWFTDTTGVSPGVQPNCARHKGGSGAASGAYRNLGLAPCLPGQVYKAQGLIKGSSANGSAYVYISWCNASGAEVGTTVGNSITGSATSGSYAVGVAPAGTVFARTCLAVISHTAGDYLVDNVMCTQHPASIDEVPDGATFVKSMQQAGTGASWIIDNSLFQLTTPGGGFSVPGWVAGAGAQIYSGNGSPVPAYGNNCLVLLTVSGAANSASCLKSFPVKPGDSLSLAGLINSLSGAATRVAVNFYTATGTFISQFFSSSVTTSAWSGVSVSGTVPTNAATAQCALLSAGGGAYYSCINFIQVTVNDVRVAGSGTQIGNQANLQQRTVTNIPAKVPSVMSYSATSTSATVTVAAFTVLAGSLSVHYNAMSVTIAGSAGVTFTYYLYVNDPNFAGGTQTLLVSGNGNDVYAGDGYVFIGPITITFPSSGSGSGGGGGGGSGACVCADMMFDTGHRAADAQIGDLFDCLDMPTRGVEKFQRRLESMEMTIVDCVRLVTEHGAVLDCSTTTPFDLVDGRMSYAPLMKGEQVLTDWGFETIVEVKSLGELMVCHIHLGGCSYAAGVDPKHRIYSHNTIAKP
jgi:hypothetical protein